MPEPAAPPLERIGRRTAARSIAPAARQQRPPLKKRLSKKVASCPVPVPRADWEKVICGTKPMFRTYSGSWRDRSARLFRADEDFPRPVIIYSHLSHHPKRVDVRLAVILDYRREPLGAISLEDIQTEGFASLREFKRYWRLRYPKWGWRPLDLVSVIELRPWDPDDAGVQGEWLLRQLYEEWL